VPVALVLASVAMILRAVPNSREHAEHRFDTVGSVTSAIAVLALIFVLHEGPVHGWTEPATVLSLVSVEGGYLAVLPGMLAMGLGMGLSMTPSTEAITGSLPRRARPRSPARHRRQRPYARSELIRPWPRHSAIPLATDQFPLDDGGGQALLPFAAWPRRMAAMRKKMAPGMA
jgi:hypothetical protein